MWNYDDDKENREKMDDEDDLFVEDVDASREFKTVEAYLDEYEDGV